MADNYSKLWIQRNLNQTAIQRAQETIAMTGSALPCHVVAVSGSIVTVAFDVDTGKLSLPNVTIPKAESNWIRYPTQIGDKGMTMPSDVYLGGISGLGSGVPKLNVTPGNLSALVFVPVSNKNSPPTDQNAAIAQGPNGFIGQTTTGVASSVATNTSGTTITFGASTIVINASGITMSAAGQTVVLSSAGILFNGLNFGTHYHTGVTTGTGNTGGPA